MTFHEPQIVTLGWAEDLIREIISLFNTEGIPDGFMPAWHFNGIYVTDIER